MKDLLYIIPIFANSQQYPKNSRVCKTPDKLLPDTNAIINSPILEGERVSTATKQSAINRGELFGDIFLTAAQV